MMWRRLVVVALMMILSSLGPASAAAVDAQATVFIQNLGNQALAVVRSNMAPTQKLQYIRELLDQDFDMPEISRFVLGPYWRLASSSERQQFTERLSDDLVRFYRQRFTRYEGETFEVTGSRPDPAGTIVTSQILRPNGPPIEVDWQLTVQNGLYKINDVIIDNVSMALSEREAFARQIQLSGGQVASLLARMERDAGVGAPVSKP
jgi:phospholipid transport system substrate-binding protein